MIARKPAADALGRVAIDGLVIARSRSARWRPGSGGDGGPAIVDQRLERWQDCLTKTRKKVQRIVVSRGDQVEGESGIIQPKIIGE